jgi:ABC-2 type transport system permease protein
MIRTTLMVTPSRWPALAAKGVVVGCLAFATSLVGEFIGAVLAWLFADGAMRFDLFTTDGLPVWFGSSFDVCLFSLMGLATGALLRSTSVSVLALMLGVMLVLPVLAAFLLASANASSVNVLFYLPSVAAVFVYVDPMMKSMGTPVEPGAFDTVAAVATMSAWTIIPRGGAFLRFVRSD